MEEEKRKNRKKDREKEIIDLLIKEKRLSTTRIGQLLVMDYYRTLKILKKLESEKKIKKDVETNSVYWKL